MRLSTHGSSATLSIDLSGLSAWTNEPELYQQQSSISPVASLVFTRLSPSEPLGPELSRSILMSGFAASKAVINAWAVFTFASTFPMNIVSLTTSPLVLPAGEVAPDWVPPVVAAVWVSPGALGRCRRSICCAARAFAVAAACGKDHRRGEQQRNCAPLERSVHHQSFPPSEVLATGAVGDTQ